LRAVEGLEDVAPGAGALGAHDGADVELGHAHHDLRLELALDGQRLANEVDGRHVGQAAVDDDDVGHVGLAHVERLVGAAGLDDEQVGPGQDALGDLADDTRIVDDHTAFHVKTLLRAPEGAPNRSAIREA
jgi:hypothetical protein